MNTQQKNDAEILAIEQALDALKEAKYILETNPPEKYGPHFEAHPAYKGIIKYVEAKIDLTEQTLRLWKSGAISH